MALTFSPDGTRLVSSFEYLHERYLQDKTKIYDNFPNREEKKVQPYPIQQLQNETIKAKLFLTQRNLRDVITCVVDTLKNMGNRTYLHLSNPKSTFCELDIRKKDNNIAQIYLYQLGRGREQTLGTIKKLDHCVELVFTHGQLAHSRRAVRLDLNPLAQNINFCVPSFKKEVKMLSKLSEVEGKMADSFCSLLDASDAAFSVEEEKQKKTAPSDLFMYTPFYSGGDCIDVINKIMDLDSKKLLDSRQFMLLLPGLFKSLLEQLDYVHDELDIVHGDIKPDNFFMQGTGLQLKARLGDWGSIDQIHGRSYEYFPPEDRRGLPGTREKDIWALGCSFLTMVNQALHPWGGVQRNVNLLAQCRELLSNKIDEESKAPFAEEQKANPNQRLAENMQSSITYCQSWQEWLGSNSFEKLVNLDPEVDSNEIMEDLTRFTEYLRSLDRVIFISNQLPFKKQLLQGLDRLQETLSSRANSMWEVFQRQQEIDQYTNPGLLPMVYSIEHPFYPFEKVLRELVRYMLVFDPSKRPSTKDVLECFGDRLEGLSRFVKNSTYETILDNYTKVTEDKVILNRLQLERLLGLGEETITLLSSRLRVDGSFQHVEVADLPPFDVCKRDYGYDLYLDTRKTAPRNTLSIEHVSFAIAVPLGDIPRALNLPSGIVPNYLNKTFASALSPREEVGVLEEGLI